MRHLSDNPRTIKRVVNLYRFHRFVAYARQLSTLPLDVAKPEQDRPLGRGDHPLQGSSAHA